MRDAIGFTVGDRVWIASGGTRQVEVPCPVCFGKRVVSVILGNDEVVRVDCDYCGKGWEGPRGFTMEYQWLVGAELRRVTGRSVNDNAHGQPGVRVTYYCDNGCSDDTDTFATEAEAVARCAVIVAEYEAEELKRLTWRKEKATKSYAWHVGYHRRGARDARRQMEYHEGKVVAMKALAKTPVAEDEQ